MIVAGFLFRAVLGGILVASVPILAARLGNTAGGLLMLLPVVTLVSLVYVSWDVGAEKSGLVAMAGLLGLPSVAAFLAVVWLLSSRINPFWIVLSLGLVTWLIVSGAIYWLIEVRSR